MITIQGNGIIQTIVVTKHLSTNLKKLDALLCFDCHNGITYKKEDMMFASELDLFSVGVSLVYRYKLWRQW